MIGFEEVRKYAFAYINTVCQALQGIFFENIGQVDVQNGPQFLPAYWHILSIHHEAVLYPDTYCYCCYIFTYPERIPHSTCPGKIAQQISYRNNHENIS